jgi:SAM-dependent methyltransferase
MGPVDAGRAALRALRARSRVASKRGELRHWRSWIKTRGGDWPEAFERALDPSAPLREPLIADRIADLATDPVEILDVGAGPMTALGKVHPAKLLQITAVDPLAADYDRLLRQAGISPPVPTVRCAGEELVSKYGAERFDVVYARNSLDHSADAPRVVDQMLAVLRPGGFVALRHYRNEAEREGYWGMHRWNCDIDDGNFILWGKGRSVNLNERLAGRAHVECSIEPTNFHAPYVLGVMTKL